MGASLRFLGGAFFRQERAARIGLADGPGAMGMKADQEA